MKNIYIGSHIFSSNYSVVIIGHFSSETTKAHTKNLQYILYILSYTKDPVDSPPVNSVISCLFLVFFS